MRRQILAIERWKQMWNNVRPPVQGWYEMKGKGFNAEARRCRQLGESATRQEIQIHARDALMDMYRAATLDFALCNRHKV